MNYQEQYQEWLTNPYFDEETKTGIKKQLQIMKMR